VILKPTRWQTLLAIFVLAVTFGWSLSHLWVIWFGVNLNVSWLVPLAMTLLAISLLAWTLIFKRRINPEQRDSRINPIVAARTAALALSASRVGSLAAGFYCGVLLTNVLNLQLVTAAQRVIVCAITVVASIVTVIVALWLERMCRLPEPPRETDSLAR
jgi:hypothetical protein